MNIAFMAHWSLWEMDLDQIAIYLLGSIYFYSTKGDDSALKRVEGDSLKIISAEIHTPNLVCVWFVVMKI